MEEEKKKKTTNNKKKDTTKKKKTSSKKVDSKKTNSVKKNDKKVEKKVKVEEVKKEVKAEPKLEKVVEETKVIAATKAKEEMNNESTRSKVIIAALSILVFIMIVLLIYKFNDRLKEDNRYKDTIRDYCEQLAKKEEKQQRENVAKEINSKDLDNIKFKKVTCEYNEPDKLSKKDLKNNDSGYLYVVSIKKDGKVSYTKEILVMKSNDKWFAEEK